MESLPTTLCSTRCRLSRLLFSFVVGEAANSTISFLKCVLRKYVTCDSWHLAVVPQSGDITRQCFWQIWKNPLYNCECTILTHAGTIVVPFPLCTNTVAKSIQFSIKKPQEIGFHYFYYHFSMQQKVYQVDVTVHVGIVNNMLHYLQGSGLKFFQLLSFVHRCWIIQDRIKESIIKGSIICPTPIKCWSLLLCRGIM